LGRFDLFLFSARGPYLLHHAQDRLDAVGNRGCWLAAGDVWRRNGSDKLDVTLFVPNTSSLNRRVLFLSYAPVFLWIGVIFYLSSSNGSMAETSRFIGPLLHFLFPSAAEETLVALHGFIRKSAHFIGYAILAFLTVRAITSSPAEAVRKYRLVIPLILVSLIAVIDEFNQSRNPSRTGSVLDVLLDISGGVAMVVTLWLANWPRLPAGEEHSNSESR